MQDDILFDNIYIGHSVEDAAAVKAATWEIKNPLERALEEAAAPPKKDYGLDDDENSPLSIKFAEDPVGYIKQRTELFIEIAKRDPIEAAKFVPEVAGAAAVALVGLIAAISSVFAAGAPAAPPIPDSVKAKAQQAKDAAVKAKDQAADAVTTGAEKAREEVNKRTTRSQQ